MPATGKPVGGKPEGCAWNDGFHQEFEVAVIQTNTKGAIRSWSIGAERLLGHPARAVLGLPIDLIYPDEARRREVPQAERVILRHDGVLNEVGWRQHADKSMIAVHAIGSATTTEDPVCPDGFLFLLRPVNPSLLQGRTPGRRSGKIAR